MNISNINLTNYKNLHSQYKRLSVDSTQKPQVSQPIRHSSVMSVPSFGDYERYLEKHARFTPEEQKTINSILENYEYVYNTMLFFHCTTLKKFKQAYPRLIGENQRGFVFANYPDVKGPKLQVVRMNRKDDTSECLSIAMLDKHNNKLIRYRIDFNGGATIYYAPDQKVDLLKGKFSSISDNKDFLKQIDNEFKLLRVYAENYKEIFSNAKGSTDEKVIGAELLKFNDLLNSKGLKKENNKVHDLYLSLSSILNLGTRNSSILKQEFFGTDYKDHSKSMLFRHVGKNDRVIAFTPSNITTDNRLFRVSVFDKNENLENSFVFFADGRIAKQKVPSVDKKSFSNANLIFISDKEIKEFGLQEVLSSLEHEFNRFKEYILEKYPRRKKIAEKEVVKTTRKSDKAQLTTPSDIKKAIKQNRVNSMFLKRVQQKKTRTSQFRNNLQAISEEDKQARMNKLQELSEQRQSKESASSKIKSKLIYTPHAKSKPEVKPKKSAVEPKKSTVVTKPVQEKVVVEKPQTDETKTVDGIFSPYYSDLRLSAVVDKLNKLFATPVEERSPHLIHEKLSNGNVFAGRVTFIADDGTKIAASRVKSAKYVDFVYYSIRINKDGQETVFNLDPEMGKILKSENGKPVIDSRGMVKYISKVDYRRQNPVAYDLPEYLNQLFEVRDNQKRKFIKNVSSKSLKQKMIEKLEKQFIENPPRESLEL